MQELKIVLLARLPILLIMYFVGIFYPNFLKMSSFFGVILPEDLPSYDFEKTVMKKYRRDFSIYCGIYLFFFTIVLINKNTDAIFTRGLLIFSAIWIIIFNISQKRTKNFIKALSKNKSYKAEINKNIKSVKKNSSLNKIEDKPSYILSPLYFVFPLIISIIMLILNLIGYEKLPLRLPVFWNLSGQIPILISKGYDIVLIYPIIALTLTIIFLTIYKNINTNNSLSINHKKLSSVYIAYSSIVTSIVILLFDLVSIGSLALSGTILMTIFYLMIISIVLYGLYIYIAFK